MSFFSNFQSDKCPGSISGNPLNGMCEKVCIQAQKIFDACIKQIQIENYTLTLTDQIPADPTYPLTFISARSTTSTGVITNLNVERLADKPGCARVQATVGIPVEIVYTDANGVEGVAQATISVSQDVLLFVPAPSIMPYKVTSKRGVRGRHVQSRHEHVQRQRLSYRDFKGCNRCGNSRSQLRLLRYTARAGVFARGMRRFLRTAFIPAGQELFQTVKS